MIAVTIRITTNVHYGIIKYNDDIRKISKFFFEALASGLNSTYRGDLAWVATDDNVVIAFRPANNRKQYEGSNFYDDVVITEYILITIIARDFDTLNKYVNKVVDTVKNAPYLLFNVEVIDCGKQ